MARVNIAGAFVGGAMLLIQLTAIGVAHEDDAAAAQLDPDYAAGKTAIKAKRWGEAISALASAALRDTQNADIQNYLGVAYRNAGQLDEAFRHYKRALALSPRHRGAHEHFGEAYLLVNDLARAEEELEALHQICLIPCEEFDELKEKIEAYKRSGTR
jgi:Flp pilus assembly protein TadD